MQATEEDVIEFQDCEIADPAVEKPEPSLTCPACASKYLDFAMQYAVPDPETIVTWFPR